MAWNAFLLRYALRAMVGLFAISLACIVAVQWLGTVLPQRGVLSVYSRYDAITYLLDVDRGVTISVGDVLGARRVWSMDGTREVRIVVDATQSQMTAFYILPAHETRPTNPQVLFRNEQAPSLPSWSPDATQLALSLRPVAFGMDQLFLLNPKNGALTQLTEADLIYTNPQYSPDGKFLVCQGFEDSQWDLAIYEFATGTIRWLTRTPTNESDPQWSPDGTRILFMSDEQANPDLYTIAIDGTQREPIVTGRYIDSSGRWSRDGRYIAFLSLREGGVPQIFLYDSMTRTIQQLTVGEGYVQPIWWR